MTFTCQPTERDDTVFNPAVGYYEPNVVDLTHAPPVNVIVYLSRATISVGGIIFPLKTISFDNNKPHAVWGPMEIWSKRPCPDGGIRMAHGRSRVRPRRKQCVTGAA